MAKKKTPPSKPDPKKPDPKKLGPKKLGRGLSALMADIAVPETQTATNPDTSPPKTPPLNTGPSETTPQEAVSLESGQSAPPKTPDGLSKIPIERIERNPSQPRKVFDKDKLAELCASIKSKGILQPILVRPLPETYATRNVSVKDRYQIVAGERRWLAAQAAGYELVPALVRELSDIEVLEIGVVENVQRADLGPMEEAVAYEDLIRQFGRKQSEIAHAVGKSRSHVANILRLLNLPKLAQEYLKDGKITAGHARAILSAPDPQALADVIVKDGLSVRAAENWARTARKAMTDQPSAHMASPKAPDVNLQAVEHKLSEIIGMSVTINHKNPGGIMSIRYKTLEQFDALVKLLNNNG